jgi:hypothetical protein
MTQYQLLRLSLESRVYSMELPLSLSPSIEREWQMQIHSTSANRTNKKLHIGTFLCASLSFFLSPTLLLVLQ